MVAFFAAIWTFLGPIVRTLGLAGTLLVLGFFYYEGIPYVKDNPLTRDIPILREFVHGRVQNEVNKAVAQAEREFIVKLEKETLEATLAKIARDKAVAELSQERLRASVDRAMRDAQETAQRLESEILEKEAELARTGRSCSFDDSDIEWLRN